MQDETLLAKLLQRQQQEPEAAELLFQIAAQYHHQKQLDLARSYYLRGLEQRPDVWEAHLALASICSVDAEPQRAAAHYHRAASLNPNSRAAWFGLANSFVRSRNWPAFEACYQEIHSRFGDLREQPAIFLNTLPRSASIYLTTRLRAMLGREFLMVAELDSPAAELFEVALAGLARGGVVTQAHLDASDSHLTLLNQHLSHLLVQIRDPRQAMLSLLHLVLLRQGAVGMQLPAPLPPDYFTSSLSDQLDWHLNHSYPMLLDWISGWLAVQEQGRFKGQLLLMRYEDFHADSPGFFARLLRFYGLDPTQFDTSTVPPIPGHLNYRAGRLDEWRDVFSPKQQARATEMMPVALRLLYP